MQISASNIGSNSETFPEIFSKREKNSPLPLSEPIPFDNPGDSIPFGEENQPVKRQPPELLGERKTICKAAFDVLRRNNIMACHEVYLTIRQGKGYSGMLPVHKIAGLAKNLGKTPHNVREHLKKLEKVGLIEKRKTIWFTISDAILTAQSGRTRKRLIDVTRAYGSRVAMTTFHYSVLIAEQGKRLQAKKQRNNHDDFSKAFVPMSISYNAIGIGKSERTVGKQRRRAKEMGFLKYKRCFNTVYTGASPVGFQHDYADGKGFIRDRSVVQEDSALFRPFSFPSIKFRGISPSLRSLAKDCYQLAR